jgi:hypothetical protein
LWVNTETEWHWKHHSRIFWHLFPQDWSHLML